MANKLSFWNITKANAEISATADVLAPALAKAGIATIAVDGKTCPATEAPLAAQVAALLAAQPVAADSQNAAEALVSNELISKELEATKTENALKTTAVEGLTRDKAALTGQLSAAQATVQDLTVKNTVLTQERDACSNQFALASKEVTACKTLIAEKALAANCLDLKVDGQPLAAAATPEAKLKAALEIPFASVVSSVFGAVNTAMSKTGVTLFAIPQAPAAAATQPELKGRARFVAAGLNSATSTK